MRKFKLIKEYPVSLPIGSIVEEWGGIYVHGYSKITFASKSIENFPEFWEEIKEPEANALGQKLKGECIIINTMETIGEENRYDDDIIDNGDWSCFSTLKQAKSFDERQMAIMRVWNWAKLNDDFVPDWENNCYIGIKYCFEEDKFKTIYIFDLLQADMPVFSSIDKGNQFIKDNEQDLKTILRIS